MSSEENHFCATSTSTDWVIGWLSEAVGEPSSLSKLCPVELPKAHPVLGWNLSWMKNNYQASLNFPNFTDMVLVALGKLESRRPSVWPRNSVSCHPLIKSSCALGHPGLIISCIDHWGLLVSNDFFFKSLPSLPTRVSYCFLGLEVKSISNLTLGSWSC